VGQTDFKDLPKFREQMPMHFSKNQRYQMQEGDQNYYSTLEEVFQAIPREVVIQIELKDAKNKHA
jgi:Tfp pilus assembly protein PilN